MVIESIGHWCARSAVVPRGQSATFNNDAGVKTLFATVHKRWLALESRWAPDRTVLKISHPTHDNQDSRSTRCCRCFRFSAMIVYCVPAQSASKALPIDQRSFHGGAKQ